MCGVPLVSAAEVLNADVASADVASADVASADVASADVASADVVLAESVAVLRAAADALAGIDPAELSEPQLGDALLDLLQVRRQVDGAITSVGHRFAHSNAWAADGARDATGWVRGRTQEGYGAARRVFATASECFVFDQMGAALRRGEISLKHVTVLGEVARAFPRLQGHLKFAQPQIVALAAEREPAQFARSLTAMCHRLDPIAAQQDAKAKEREYYLRASTLMDGAVRLDAMLPADVGQLLMASLEAARRTVTHENDAGDGASDRADGDGASDRADCDADGGSRDATEGQESAEKGGDIGPDPLDRSTWQVDMFGTPIPPPELDPIDHRMTGQRNIEALHRILTLASTATPADGGLASVAGTRPTINVTVPVETLTAQPGQAGVDCGWLERFGVPHQPITPDTARRLACDATLRPLLMGSNGQLVAFGTASRVIPPAMRALVVRRDSHCRFAGCRARIDEVHHLIYYSQGGPTRSDNLIGLCWHHHHLVHEGGWQLTGDPNHEVTGTGPDGRTWTTGPPHP